jgi:hypothetical protein
MKVEINGCVAFGKFDWEGGRGGYRFFDMTEPHSAFVKVADYTVAVEIPDSFDPRGHMVSVLEQEKAKITAEFQKRVTEINGQIQSLLAIENKPSEVAS